MIKDDLLINFDDPILITGANGFIGSRVVETLLGYGFRNLRCFVRPNANLKSLNKSIGTYDTYVPISDFKTEISKNDIIACLLVSR